MAQVKQSNAETLRWIKPELESSLARVRRALETSLDAPEDRLPLQRALLELHQVRGSLSMVQCQGAVVLVEEMKAALQHLMAKRTELRSAAVEAMLGASLQLADYVDFLIGGQRDNVLVFHPLINELRVSGDRKVISEADLFSDYLKRIKHEPEQPDLSNRQDRDGVQRVAKRYLPVYQASLLRWIKEEDIPTTLKRLRGIAAELAGQAQHVDVYYLARLLEAVVAILQAGGTEDNLEIKRLFGRAGQQLKQLAMAGESEDAPVPAPLLHQLLYILGRSENDQPLVAVLREAWSLDQVLPSISDLAALRKRLRGPNTQLMMRLSSEIREDIAAAKDIIDLVARAGDKSPAKLDEAAATIERVAETLGMLGLDMLKRIATNQSTLIEKLRDDPDVDAQSWLNVAVTLLRIEHSIDAGLFGQLTPAGEQETSDTEPVNQRPSPLELKVGSDAAIRESLVNLAKVKNAISAFLREGEAGELNQAGRLLREVEASLLILGEQESASCVQALSSFITSEKPLSIRQGSAQADVIAEAVAALEYYLELLRAEGGGSAETVVDLRVRIDRLSALDDTEIAKEDRAVELAPDLGSAIDSSVADREAEEIFIDLSIPSSDNEESHDLQVDTDSSDALLVEVSADGPALEVTETAEEVAPVTQSVEAVDPEIREVFLEEAQEVMTQLASDHGRWKSDRSDLDLLGEIRRAFHTMKGSGRMVGAEQIGESAWAVEALLNQCLEGALPPSDEVGRVVAEAIPAMQEMVSDFSVGRPTTDEQVARIVTICQTAQGKTPVEASLPPLSVDCDAEPATEAADAEVDKPASEAEALSTLKGSETEGASTEHNLFQVFREDARERLLLLKAVPDQVGQSIHPDWVRALHALVNGAERVGEPDAAKIAGNLEDLLETLRFSATPLSSEVATLVAEVTDDLSLRVESSENPGIQLAVAEEILGKIADVRATLPEEVVTLAEEQKIAVTFTDEACDLLDNAESAVDLWKGDGCGEQKFAAVQTCLHALLETAKTADFLGMALLAEAIEEMTALALPAAKQDAAVAEHIEQGLDGLYQLLDAYRHGHRDMALPELVESLKSFGQSYALHEVDQPDDDAIADELSTGAESNLDTVDDAQAKEPVETFPESGPDPELLNIFLGEATELLESLEAEHERWVADPDQAEPRRAILRLLHTLKGSARMAHAEGMGNLSHELESLIGEVEIGRRAADAAVTDKVRDALDGLHGLLDAARKGDLDRSAENFIAGLGDAAGVLTEESTQTLDIPELIEDAAEDSDADAAAIDIADELSVQDLSAQRPADNAWQSRLFWSPKASVAEPVFAADEMARVRVDELDDMLNESGEVNIFRARLDQQTAVFRGQLTEFQQTIERIREQLRTLDTETEAQIQAGRQHEADDFYQGEFDALEMDRYTRLNELSRGLNESATDLSSLHESMSLLSGDTETLLLQQGRVASTLQQSLMQTLMVPFARQLPRFERVVRQASQDTGKKAKLEYDGVAEELDRKVLERIAGPLEHLLRNAVVHGIETPEVRTQQGKVETGQVAIQVRREGSQVVIRVSDDGAGLDYDRIKEQAVSKGLIEADTAADHADLIKLIFTPGFSTAAELTHSAGRGVGMDVVDAEIKKLGGSVDITSKPEQGTKVAIRLPLSLALTHALMVKVNAETYAIPLRSIEGVSRVRRRELNDMLEGEAKTITYGGLDFEIRSLSALLGQSSATLGSEESLSAPVLLVSTGDQQLALVADAVVATREIVVKSPGPQVSSIPGVTGATILPDGSVVIILDPVDLIQGVGRRVAAPADTGILQPAPVAEDSRVHVMVVDDSITMRRVAERLLEKNGYRVTTAKDGMDALTVLQTEAPDVMLLDIEMPRVDGFELATYVRNSERLASTPIIMITSRGGQKHRDRATGIGVNDYLVKPYQDQDMLDAVSKLAVKDA